MNVTREWVQQQAILGARGARAAGAPTLPVREGWDNGALVVFVEGKPHNPLNGQRGHWAKHARWAKQWRERTNTRLYLVQASAKRTLTDWLDSSSRWPWEPSAPKRITFTVYGPAKYDDDNVRGVVKPCRDSLQDMRVIDSDGNPAHAFLYEQAPPTRKAGAVHGIAIRVELA